MKIIIATNHHRYVARNEDTLTMLALNGYHVIYQDTSTFSYDQGMMNFKSKNILGGDFDVVVFIDNDLFMTGLDYFKRLLNDFIVQGYGFCSYFEVGSEWHYELNGTIAPVTDQKFVPVSGDVYTFKPQPHWENAYMFLTREVWDKLKTEDLANSRNMIKAVYDIGTKMGTHKAGYKWTYSHYGPEWFHVGNLMRYFYVLENMDFSGFNPDSDIDASRIGFFIAQKRDMVPVTYDPDFEASLRFITQSRGEDYFLNKWKELINV